MKRTAVCSVLALLACCCVGLAFAAEPGPAVVRQDISVTLLPESHALSGESTISYAAGSGPVELRLSAAASIDSVSVSGRRLPFGFAGGILSLVLPAGSPGPLSIRYRASFHDPVSRQPAAAEDPSYGVNASIGTEGTFLGDGACWYPVPRQVPAHRSLTVAAPAGTEAISYGRRTFRESSAGVSRSRWEEARPVGVLTLCAGPYRVAGSSYAGIELYSYLYADDAALSSAYLDAAAKYLQFYGELFGAYPFEKFALVENFFPTGYGFPSFTLLGGEVIRLPFIIDTSFPHEIAHSWWGNGVQVDLREGNWSEGLVTYLADYLLKERRSPGEARAYRRQWLIDFASLVTPANDFPLKAFESRSDPASRAIGYGKGAMLFHMVRSQIGDRAFFQALRELYRDHVYASASWGDFARAFSRSGGRDLTAFLDQWLTRPGGPRLSLAEVTRGREAGGWSVAGTVLQATAPFQLAVPLRLQTENAQLQELVSLSGERTRFTMNSAGAPKGLLLDPDADVFRLLSPGEIPATVNSIKGSTRVLGVTTENCRAGDETFRDLLASLSQGGATVVKEEQLAKSGRGDHDLVLCGLPHDRSLLPRLPEGIDLAPSGFSLEGVGYAAPDGVLFLVQPLPGNPGRVVALFEPLSEAAARRYAAKITLYGKYSYLGFAGGANRHKGTFPPLDGATAVDFPPVAK